MKQVKQKKEELNDNNKSRSSGLTMDVQILPHKRKDTETWKG